MKRSLRLLTFLLVLTQIVFAVPAIATNDTLFSPQQSDSTTAAPVPVKVVSGANLRGGPGTTYAVVGGATAGQSLEIVAKNSAGDWFKTADGKWIFAQLLDSRPDVPVDDAIPAAPAAASAAPAQPAAAPAAASAATTSQWVLVADSAADFPGGRDKNNWYYLWSEGRNNFRWQDMRLDDSIGCYKDTADKGLQICRDTIDTNPKGDAAVQWKASRGGTYRFEWDSASLKFYQHAKYVGILENGTILPFATTISDVIEWEMFFWVAADSTPYHILVYRLEEGAAPAAPQVATTTSQASAPVAASSTAVTGVAPTFGSGEKVVGVDMPPGTYRGEGSRSCYWKRVSGLGGGLGYIIASDYSSGPQIATIAATDKGFESRSCGTWTLDQSPVTASPTSPFGDGTYFVGKDVAPGTWRASGGGNCYWERMTAFTGTWRDIRENDFVGGAPTVTIDGTDTGFKTQGCGTWTKIN